jgi:hypothetical protein
MMGWLGLRGCLASLKLIGYTWFYSTCRSHYLATTIGCSLIGCSFYLCWFLHRSNFVWGATHQFKSNIITENFLFVVEQTLKMSLCCDHFHTWISTLSTVIRNMCEHVSFTFHIFILFVDCCVVAISAVRLMLVAHNVRDSLQMCLLVAQHCFWLPTPCPDVVGLGALNP